MRAVSLGLMGLVAFGCSSPMGDDDPMDASVADMATPDGGVRALCPALETPECTAAEACGEVIDRQSNCSGCFASNRSLCLFGACESPAVLATSNPVNVRFTVTAALAPQVMSFATAAIAAETAGGAEVGCDQVYAGEVDLTSGCYNIVDSRGLMASMIGQTYPAIFSKLPTERKVLLLIWGYGEGLASMGDPIGISCTAIDVGGPDGDGVDVEGDMMRPIQ